MTRTLRQQYRTVLLAEITELNGENTEDELNMVIMEGILEDRVRTAKKLNTNTVIAEKLLREKDRGEKVINGVYVYESTSIMNFSFEKYSTIADAVRSAVTKIKAYIICNGEIIEYDALSDTEAYYIDKIKHRMVTVTL